MTADDLLRECRAYVYHALGPNGDLLKRIDSHLAAKEKVPGQVKERLLSAPPRPETDASPGTDLSFEEWHARECPCITEFHADKPCLDPSAAWNETVDDPRFAGRTCREVYDSERPKAPSIDEAARGLAFPITEALVLSILANPLGRAWSLQGFGMLRLYLTPELRLHVWDARFAVPGVSVMHDHPWHFDSLIVLGEVRQRRYAESATGDSYAPQTIACGVGGGPCGDILTVGMKALPEEVYGPGQTYRQEANEVHVSAPVDGTVTIVTRRFLDDAEHAHVFWPNGTKWVSAEPRPATDAEVMAICSFALDRAARERGRR